LKNFTQNLHASLINIQPIDFIHYFSGVTTEWE